MESTKEVIMKKGKRPKSPTRYPKRLSTYIVGFAMQETIDEPQKLQVISNKKSAENSTPSISPSGSNNSAKTFTITPTEQLSRVLDIATLSEVKIDMLDDNQCGDVVEKKFPQISSYVVLGNRTGGEQPEVILNAPKYIKRYKASNRCTRKKTRKNKRVINFKNVQFNVKKEKNSITRRLEKYYQKTKSNLSNAGQLQNQICNDVLSNVVSRSRVLKKVLARENSLADSDRISSLDGVSIFDRDNDSINSSPSSTQKSFISYTSQNTLVCKDSPSSRKEDFNCIKTVSSDNQILYKSDIISVSMAVAFNASNTNTDQSAASNETLVHKENLTSSETFVQNDTAELTSKPPSSDEPNFQIDYDDLTIENFNEENQSNKIQKVKSGLGVPSEEDTFVIARTSSDFHKSSNHSNGTVSYSRTSETTFPSENAQSTIPSNDEFSDDIANKRTLLDKVKYLGFYPTKTPSVDSRGNLVSDLNNVLVTDTTNIRNNLPLTAKNMTENLSSDIQKKSVLRKPVDLNNMTLLQNNISLPTDFDKKTKLKEVEEAKRSCPDSVRNKYPTDLAEMWERLTIVIDFAVKRLEDTLADKIEKEIRESLAIFKQPEYKVPTVEIQRIETVAPAISVRPIPTMLHKEIFVVEDFLKRDVNACVQCDLVQTQVIDQLLLKLSAEAPIPSSADTLKILQPPELLKDHFEILKPPVALAKESASEEAGKGDSVTVSTATTALSTRSNFNRFIRLLSFPIAFVRENTIVLTSVPTFFIVLFCLYGVMVILLNP